MGQTRNRDTVRVNEEGKKQLIKAKAGKTNYQGKIWTYPDIATASNVSEATVKRFFARKDVDRPYAEAIAKALDLNLDDLIDTTPPEDTPPVLPEHKPDTSINWPDICRGMLQNQATSNKLLHQDEDTKKEREQIYVPLALVQRKKVEKRDKGDFAPDAGTLLYEPNYEQEQKFEHEAFLSQILEQGEGKTKGRQVALIGEPGAGKTTLLQTIAFWILDQNLGLPIWISLADLGRNGNEINLQQYICEIWLKQAVSTTEFTPEENVARKVIPETNHQKAIHTLVDLIHDSNNEYIKLRAAESLEKIDNSNEYAIQILVNLIHNSDDKNIKLRAAECLGKIGNGNENAIQALVELIRNSDNEDTKYWLAKNLKKIGNGNEYAIQALVDLIRNSDDEDTKKRAAYSLDKITEIEQMAMVITNLQKYLPNDVYENDSRFDREIYELFWNFAQNLSYPEFYAAWQQGIEN